MIACLFSCEHATCAVPEAFRELFKGSEEAVTSTKGWDPGALNLAQGFSMKFRTPLVHGDVTRLLIDLDVNGEERWSRFSKTLPEATRVKLVDRHERPYRLALRARIKEELTRNNTVVHIMIHTGETGPELALEIVRDGLAEEVAGKWKSRLVADGVEVKVVTAAATGDGLMWDLAGEHPADRYALLRLIVPQSYFLEGKPLRWETLKKFLLTSLPQVIAGFDARE